MLYSKAQIEAFEKFWNDPAWDEWSEVYDRASHDQSYLDWIGHNYKNSLELIGLCFFFVYIKNTGGLPLEYSNSKYMFATVHIPAKNIALGLYYSEYIMAYDSCFPLAKYGLGG